MAITKIWDHKRLQKRNADKDARQSITKGIFYVENPEKTTEKTIKYQIKAEPDGVVASVYDSLNKGVNYAENEEKTTGKKELSECFLEDDTCVYITGFNCRSDKEAIIDFVDVKRKFEDFRPDITHYHAVQSFKGHECSPDIAHEIGCKLAEKLWTGRFQVVVCTHINTENVHNHFIINATSFVDGKRFYDNKSNYYELRRASDLLCEEYGLSVIEDRKGRAISRKMNEMENKGAPTRLNIARAAIDMSIEWARTIDEMKLILNEFDFETDFSPEHKHWTIKSKGWQKPIRLKRIAEKYGDGYTKKGILLRLDDEKKTPEDADTEEMLRLFRKAFEEESRQIKTGSIVSDKDTDSEIDSPGDYSEIGDHVENRDKKQRNFVIKAYLTRSKHHARLKHFDRSRPYAKGYYAYYLRWLYLLGVLPGRRRKINPRYALFIHYSVRDDLLNIEHILNEAKILSWNHIEDLDDLFDHTAVLQREAENLAWQIKDKGITAEKREELKKELKEKRKEINYCDHIYERSLRLDEGLTENPPPLIKHYSEYVDSSMFPRDVYSSRPAGEYKRMRL